MYTSDSFLNMGCLTQINVLHLWEFNTEHRKNIHDILYIIYVLEIITATDSEEE